MRDFEIQRQFINSDLRIDEMQNFQTFIDIFETIPLFCIFVEQQKHK